MEIDVRGFDKIEFLPFEGNHAKTAPLRIMSIDIECSAPATRFPEYNLDPVIQIASIVKIQGETDYFARNIFTLK